MALYLLLKKMGGGKTALMTWQILKYLEMHPNRKAYTNFKIDHPRVEYYPYGFMPFDDLENCVIGFDDMEDLKWLNGFQSILSNYSRKLGLTIYCTGQYYTQFSRKMRSLCDYVIQPSWSKKYKRMWFNIHFIKPDGSIIDSITGNYIDRPFSLIGDNCGHTGDLYKGRLYETRQIVRKPYPHIIKRKILERSKTPNQLDTNVYMWRGSSERKFLNTREELYDIKGWNTSDQPDAQNIISSFNKETILQILIHKLTKLTQGETGSIFGTAQEIISRKEKDVRIKLTQYVNKNYNLAI